MTYKDHRIIKYEDQDGKWRSPVIQQVRGPVSESFPPSDPAKVVSDATVPEPGQELTGPSIADTCTNRLIEQKFDQSDM